MKFNLDGPILTFLNKALDIIMLSIMWCVCCIPIFTAGAATTALYYVVNKSVRNNKGYVVSGYFKAFKENFKVTLAPSIIFAVVTIVWVVDMIILYTNIEQNHNFFMLMVVLTILWVQIMVYAIWTFALTARFKNTWKKTMSNAFVIMFAHLPTTIVVISIFVVTAVVLYLLIPSMVFVPALSILLISFLTERIFKKYIK